MVGGKATMSQISTVKTWVPKYYQVQHSVISQIKNIAIGEVQSTP